MTETKKKMTTQKSTSIAEKIAKIFAYEDPTGIFSYTDRDNLSNGWWEAWENWDDDTLSGYDNWEGEKPEEPTPGFIFAWVVDELEAVPENYPSIVEYAASL